MLRAILKLVSFLPLSFLHTVGGKIGLWTYALSPKLKAKTLKNIALVNLPESIARESARQNGMLAAETAWIWGRPNADVASRCTFLDAEAEVLEQSIKDQHAILFMTPHVGGFEATPIAVYERFLKPAGKSLTILYREPKNSLVRPFVRASRTREGMDPASADLGGVKKIVRAMRAGGILGCLPDQVPGRGEGVWVPFFGKLAFTMSFPMKIARQFNTDIFIVWGERHEKVGWTIHMKKLDLPLTGEAEHDASLMNKAIEEVVMKQPDQYIWNYNRFKGLNHHLQEMKQEEKSHNASNQ